MNGITIDGEAKKLLCRLNEAGFEAYLVGGCVRDLLIGRVPADYDVTSSALPEEVAALFEHVVPTGIRQGTVLVLDYGTPIEVTTFRTEGEYGDHRHPDKVTFGKSLKEDLSRRDFTVNAMVLDSGGNVYDFFGGREDLKGRVLRTVGDADKRFSEDSLRMLRAVRFAARGFNITGETREAMSRNAGLCKYLSAERVAAEIEKILMSELPETIRLLLEYGLIKSHLTDSEGSDKAVPDFSALNGLPERFSVRFAVFSSILLRSCIIPSAETFSRGLRLPAKLISTAAALDRYVNEPPPRSALEGKKLLCKEGAERAVTLSLVYDTMYGKGAAGLIKNILSGGECYSLDTLDIDGDTIVAHGYSGSAVGEKLKELLFHVMRFPGDNKKEILISML
jgi:tRNA nucleotidyltransferase (CCA-adding enzyme)